MLHPQSPRPWWSRSSSVPKNCPNEKQTNGTGKQGKKFNTLATAIGLKPRKPTLTIQEPPSPTLPLHTGSLEPHPPSVNERPSTYHSWDEAEPRTPSDLQKHLSYAQSVLTTSEMDPFASQYLPSPASVMEDARYSVFSDSSTSDSYARKNDFTLNYNRASFTSSSDQSHSKPVAHLSPPISPRSPPFDAQRLSRLTVASDKIIRREPPFMPSSASPVSSSAPRPPSNESPQIRPSLSSSTLTDKPKASDAISPPVPRLKTRPRGLTDVGPSRPKDSPSACDVRPPPLQHPSDNSSPASSPRVLVRQPSLPRAKIVPSPTAPPPTAGLPPTPPIDVHLDPSLRSHLRESSPTSPSSSSSISFASSTSSCRDHALQRFDPRDSRQFDKSTRTGPSPPSDRNGAGWGGTTFATATQSDHRHDSNARSLKKAVSSHNLHKQSSIASTASTSSATAEDVRSVKKQRSFHHTRMIPIPPLPSSLRHANSSGSVPQTYTPVSPPPREDTFSHSHSNVEQRRGSATSQSMHSPPSVRRRLFSGASLRRSISSQAPSVVDDDSRSVFSTSDDRDRPGFNNPFSTSSDSRPTSFWDDGDMPSSPGRRTQDFSPQHIMAPADMLKLEALVQDESSTAEFLRSRGQSFTSVSTSFSNAFSDAISSEEMGPAPSSRSSRLGEFTTNRNPASGLSQYAFRSDTLPSSPTHPRPLSAQNEMAHARTSEEHSAGLPPPPRPRVRPATSTGASHQSQKRMSVAPINPLSPPPSWRSNGRRALSKPSVAPVPKDPGRPMIIRKPSFLEIDDDADRKKRPAAATAAAPADSFLDLGKSSFDTVRSSLEDFGPN